MTTAARRSVAVLLVLGALVPPACGGGEERVEPEAWTREVCTSLGRWRDRLADRGRVLETDLSAAHGRLTVVRAEIVRFLDDVVAETNSLAADVARAGIPAAEDGEPYAAGLRQGVGRITEEFANARAEIEGIALRRRALRRERAEIATTLAQQLGAAHGLFAELDGKYDVPELDRALAEDPDCDEFT